MISGNKDEKELEYSIGENTLDDICKNILVIFSQNPTATYDYAGLQRAAGLGSHKTVRKHVEHLKSKGLVKIKEIWKGGRRYYQIMLTEKGKKYVSKKVEKWVK